VVRKDGLDKLEETLTGAIERRSKTKQSTEKKNPIDHIVKVTTGVRKKKKGDVWKGGGEFYCTLPRP